MVNECLTCLKDYHLRLICPYRDYPDNHSKLKYKNIDCNCSMKVKLEKKK